MLGSLSRPVTSLAFQPCAKRNLRSDAPSKVVSYLRSMTSASALPKHGAKHCFFRPFTSAGRLQAMHAAAVAAPEQVAEQYSPPQKSHGFQLERYQFVDEYNSMVALYRHEKTGAQLISVVNDDTNKTFGAVLRTPVENSKGIPHILEHSVLCGSRKYPIKEPFVELMKGSLNTFLNAFTYPDRTCYPVASANLQDFYNLVDVYLDAVLHPRCIEDERTFAQEGWHYELEDSKEEMTYKGVVFNEMKGVYSSPDQANNRATVNALFPDNTYAVDSGGDPSVIPELSYDEFKMFHGRYYHPSNARFWFYGDDAPEERLRILDSYLSEFESREVDSTVGAQPLFNEPRRVTGKYAAGEGTGEEVPKAFISVNWVLSEEPVDVETELALGFLDYLLLGTSAAPLSKALNDSGLGESQIGGGLMDDLRQPIFSLGLKGVDPKDSKQVEELILGKLEECAREGFSSTAIEAAINSNEFSLRENNTGSFPRGLSLMLRASAAWIYDRDPIRPLQWTKDLEHFKARVASGEDIFGPLLRKYFLNNNHRVTVEMLPDSKLGNEKEQAEKDKLKSYQADLASNDIEATIAKTKELKERQETPDDPESLSCIPSLQLADIPKKAETVPSSLSSLSGAELLTHDLFTNNIIYLEAALNLKPVPANLLPLVPLFSRCLTQMGTDKEDFIELTERIGRKTGGVGVSPFTSDIRGQDDPAAYLVIRGKAVADKVGDLTDLFIDILHNAKLDDQARFKQMVLETKAGMEAGVIGAGHRFAASRLDAQRTTAGWVSEQMGGLSYLSFIRQLLSRVESDWDSVKADLEAIRKLLLQRQGAVVNVTADEKALTGAESSIQGFLESLPESAAQNADWSNSLPLLNEAITVPTQVNYVGKSINLYKDAGYKLSGSSFVINKLLGTTWLWDRVRVSGGAYGGFSDFDHHTGILTFLSYRDPNLLKTVDVYDGTAAFLRELQLDQDALTKAIIGTIGDIDAYQLPDAKGHTAFMRHLLKVTDADRQARREQILSTSLKDFRDFAEVVEHVKGKQGKVVAVTSPERAQAVNDKERPGFFDQIHKVL